ncbi:triacylglycerol lipase [Microdochium nivale]|nr:triacylglycerol lipase [Microdochium nivale]
MSLPRVFDYNAAQQVYCLSAASNAVGSMSATEAVMQAAMESALQEKLPQIMGGWEVSWGPRVYSRYPKYDLPPENVCFAATSKVQKRVVVAVAGTAPPAGFDWLDDANVYESVNLTSWFGKWTMQQRPTPPVGEWFVHARDMVCSEGAANGVFNTLTNPASDGALLWEYLQNIPSDYTVIFTGHSMGGAIVPVLALGLQQTGMISAGSVYTMTSAGPSIGNEAFVQGYKQAFPIKQHGSPADYATLNSDLFNSNDIVPQAWSTIATDDRTLDNIAYAIYKSADITENLLWDAILSIVKIGKGLSESSWVGYRPIPGTPFIKTPPLLQPIQSMDDAADSVLEQHTRFYWEYIGIQKFEDEFQKHVVKQPGVSKPKIIRRSVRRLLMHEKRGKGCRLDKLEVSKE